MKVVSVPLNEDLRLADLYRYNILDSEAEKDFDDLVDLAAQVCGCPMAAITFQDKERQWLKAKKNINFSETPGDLAFCAHAIRQNRPLVVKDTALDERFSANPLVTGSPAIRFYAGVPITSSAGFHLGSVCVVDHKPKDISESQIAALQVISRQVSKLLELRMLQKTMHNNTEVHQEIRHHSLIREINVSKDISTELHEHIAQGLAATKLFLEIAKDDPEPIYIQKSLDHVSLMLEDTSALPKNVFPTTVRNASIKELILQLVSKMKLGCKTKVVFSSTSCSQLPEALSLTLFQIAKAALQNIAQHASATQLEITFACTTEVKLTFIDNGKGFDADQFAWGYGMNKISMLSAFYGGSVQLDSRPGEGCKLEVTIPLKSLQS